MAKEVEMFEKFLKRLDPKDMQLKGITVQICNKLPYDDDCVPTACMK